MTPTPPRRTIAAVGASPYGYRTLGALRLSRLSAGSVSSSARALKQATVRRAPSPQDARSSAWTSTAATFVYFSPTTAAWLVQLKSTSQSPGVPVIGCETSYCSDMNVWQLNLPLLDDECPLHAHVSMAWDRAVEDVLTLLLDLHVYHTGAGLRQREMNVGF